MEIGGPAHEGAEADRAGAEGCAGVGVEEGDGAVFGDDADGHLGIGKPFGVLDCARGLAVEFGAEGLGGEEFSVGGWRLGAGVAFGEVDDLEFEGEDGSGEAEEGDEDADEEADDEMGPEEDFAEHGEKAEVLSSKFKVSSWGLGSAMCGGEEHAERTEVLGRGVSVIISWLMW